MSDMVWPSVWYWQNVKEMLLHITVLCQEELIKWVKKRGIRVHKCFWVACDNHKFECQFYDIKNVSVGREMIIKTTEGSDVQKKKRNI